MILVEMRSIRVYWERNCAAAHQPRHSEGSVMSGFRSARRHASQGLALRFGLALSCTLAVSAPVAAQSHQVTARVETPGYAASFRTADAGERNDGPTTRVTLVLRAPDGTETVRDLGRIEGECSLDTAPNPDGLSFAYCYWAGMGTNFRITQNENQVVASRVYEEEGSDGEDWEEVARIPLPAGAQLQGASGNQEVSLSSAESSVYDANGWRCTGTVRATAGVVTCRHGNGEAASAVMVDCAQNTMRNSAMVLLRQSRPIATIALTCGARRR